MNVICGLPRSGSTLLCNILNQNPRFYASSTSPLCAVVRDVVNNFSQSVDMKGQLAKDKEKAQRRIRRCAKTLCDAYYHEQAGKVVFDKSRSWAYNIIPLLEMYPDAKIIVTIRDLRDVFASTEKQHRKTPMLTEFYTHQHMTIASKMNRMFSDKGGIGSPLQGIKDIVLRQHPVHFIKYEDLAADPSGTLNRLYCYLLEEEFEHDFEDVQNTAEDPDYLYLYKYPHEGSGKVKPSESMWHEFFHVEVANEIVNRFNWFYREFGYQVTGKLED